MQGLPPVTSRYNKWSSEREESNIYSSVYEKPLSIDYKHGCTIDYKHGSKGDVEIRADNSFNLGNTSSSIPYTEGRSWRTTEYMNSTNRDDSHRFRRSRNIYDDVGGNDNGEPGGSSMSDECNYISESTWNAAAKILR